MFSGPWTETAWLIGILLACVTVLALVERWVNGLRRALRQLRDRQSPGHSPLNPLSIPAFEEIPAHIAARCPCGETPAKAFEGPTPSRQRRLWVVIQVCPRCQRTFQRYFDVTDLGGTPGRLGTGPLTPVPR